MLHLTNRFDLAMRLISYESKMTSKSGKKKKVANKRQASQYIVLNISQYIVLNISQHIVLNISQYIVLNISQYIVLNISQYIVLNVKYISTFVSIIHIHEGNYRYAVPLLHTEIPVKRLDH